MNIKESIVVISSALQNLGIPLEHADNKHSLDFILNAASDTGFQHTDVRFLMNQHKYIFYLSIYEC